MYIYIYVIMYYTHTHILYDMYMCMCIRYIKNIYIYVMLCYNPFQKDLVHAN